jgi:GT2 family glycosyltransferase
MDLSIIIVNWKSKEYLEKCISSVLANTARIDYEIIVIDNASYDGSERMLMENFPMVRYIQSEKNLGFANANNKAYMESSGKFILFLNPDTEFNDNSVKILFDNLNYLPSAAVVGCKILNTDKSIQTSCIQAFPTILNQFFDSNVLRNLFPRCSLWGMKPLFTSNADPIEVDTVSGACLMIERSVFECVGMFSPDYFMYSEDIDLCFKAKKYGRKTYFVPIARVIHHGGGSSSKNKDSSFSNVMMRESRLQYFKKNRSPIYGFLYRLALCHASVVRISLLLCVSPLYILRGRKTLFYNMVTKWIAIFRWSMGGKIIVNNT